jgi:hypothetical protein
MKALLLAAGVGSRLRPITLETPKCLVEIAGRPLLDYWLELLFGSEMFDGVVINTHYLPQLHWLANIARYLRSDAKIRIRDFKDFRKITDFQDRAEIVPPSKDFVEMLLNDNDIEIWLYLDQILLDLAGQEFTWTELLDHYQRNHKNIIDHVLPKT